MVASLKLWLLFLIKAKSKLSQRRHEPREKYIGRQYFDRGFIFAINIVGIKVLIEGVYCIILQSSN